MPVGQYRINIKRIWISFGLVMINKENVME